MSNKLTTRRAMLSTSMAYAGICAGAYPLSAAAQPDANEILLGQSAVLSGMSAGLGIEMRDGIIAAIAQANGHGGIGGRRLSLMSMDDGYEPDRTIANTNKLLNAGCLALLGFVGTPTSLAAMPMATSAKVPFVGPFTGAKSLRDPINPWVFNVRASYNNEAGPIVDQLTSGTGAAEKMAIVYQDDAYGNTVRSAIEAALAARGMKPFLTATVKRNSNDVGAAATAIAKSGATSVVVGSVYSTTALLMREIRRQGLYPKFASVSFIGTSSLINGYPKEAVGLAIAQVVPSPWRGSIPILRQYQAAMQEVENSKLSYGSLEGYISTRVLIEALTRCGSTLTRDNLRVQLEKLDVDLAGFRIRFSPESHQGSNYTEMVVIGRDGRVLG